MAKKKRSHFVVCAELVALMLPMVAGGFCADQRKDRAKQEKGVLTPEVTAPRAVGPSGRTRFC